MTPADTQQRRLLERLRQAGDQPVAFAELRACGVDFPAAAVCVFRAPPPTFQRAIFGALAPIARRRGYRATYPQISRTALAPRS
jgi:hypothetical protein